MEPTNSFETLLRTFAHVFTEPSFKTFRRLMAGWILSARLRYVTDLIVSSDSTTNGHLATTTDSRQHILSQFVRCRGTEGDILGYSIKYKRAPPKFYTANLESQ